MALLFLILYGTVLWHLRQKTFFRQDGVPLLRLHVYPTMLCLGEKTRNAGKKKNRVTWGIEIIIKT